MDLAWLTLLALTLVVALSCTTRVNPGLIAIVLAWIIAAYVSPRYGITLGDKAVAAGFPSELFLTLVAVSLLFALAEVNGTLGLAADAAMRLAGERPALVPVLFFFLALAVGSLGPGNIAVAGLIAPVAMAAAGRMGLSPLLMAVVVGHGAIASTVSPFTAAGIVANQKVAEVGLANVQWTLFTWNAAANGLAALLGMVLFGNWRSWWNQPNTPLQLRAPAEADCASRSHLVTLGTIGLVLCAVLLVRVPIGLAAFCGSALIILLGAADERAAIARVPWSVILMVVGVSVLTSLLEKTGGNQRFASLISGVSTPATLIPTLAVVTGVVSIYSSTTGVVLPAFLPMVKDIAAASPGSEPLDLALTVLVSGNLVDMSPLSTIGALCLAASPDGAGRGRLFHQLLAWGFAMAGLGALVSWLCFR